MKAILYAVISGDAVRWQASLDIQADMTLWFGRYPGSVRIRMLEPAFSFGQAVVLRDKLNVLQWAGKGGLAPERFVKAVRECAEDTLIGRDTVNRLQPVDCSYSQWLAYRQAQGVTFRIDSAELDRLVSLMQGRSLLMDEVKQLMEHYGLSNASAEPLAYVQTAYLLGLLRLDQGISLQQKRKLRWWGGKPSYRCHRCGGGAEHMVFTECMFCGTSCPYCEQCLTMGRSRYCSVTISSAEGHHEPSAAAKELAATLASAEEPPLEAYLAPWGLSEIQAEASGEALRFLKGNELQTINKKTNQPKQFLIWAVTGAGKTEMIFPMIQYTAAQGRRVVVATPRRDVVLELKPRLEKAFSPIPVVTLYGGSEQRWDAAPITIATTHQLLRFESTFDLVIIDELDAFPYHNNPMLQYAAEKVCMPGGATILLSATPPLQLQKAAKRGALPHVKVTTRYHRHPLPVPVLLTMPPLRQQLEKSALAPVIKQKIEASLQRGAQVFVFVPKIHMVEPLTKLLSSSFPHVTTQGTSSKDEHRGQKVIDFRGRNTRILVTTTILERGVTIPKSDVLILDAGEPIFDSAALVQMAGRAGRSADDPAGHVYFAAQEKTRAQVEAVRQIKSMNALARKKGYLHDKGEIKPHGNSS
ncbi:Transcription-repair-coupling factor [Paenibacillus konkukensis]|uniref:Transcription-repair-coupling factor n=1 Tax=Paenibacillus konkukensis TaxID=2020716 RepID=A0ABY4RPK1_9BACL|nr:helicase-related protein [Paenibacillus konkukensis]UQZ84402.1 Transcription-repair-coupling factor [Paenibacillus konkukensis]